MRKVNWDEVQESNGGGSRKLQAGNYVCRIQSAEDREYKDYVLMLFDIAEGEWTGEFARQAEMWDVSESKHGLYLSYTDKGLPMTKRTLKHIAESNPGFDPFAAWDAGNMSMFIGRLVGIRFREEEYDFNGKTGMSVKKFESCSVPDIRAGKVEIAKPKYLDGDAPKEPDTHAAAAVAAANDPVSAELPF